MAEELTRILLIRHGSNEYIDTGRLAGRTPGVHLNERGRGEARAVAERLGSASLTAVYTSPLERALETAVPIADRHGLRPCTLDDLLETDCGEWTGASVDELSRTDLWRLIQATPSCARHPSGESMAEVQSRMVGVVERLRVLHAGQKIAVVSHSDPIRLLLAFCTGVHIDMFQRLVIDPASISEVEFGSLTPRLIRANDCAHLMKMDVARDE